MHRKNRHVMRSWAPWMKRPRLSVHILPSGSFAGLGVTDAVRRAVLRRSFEGALITPLSDAHSSQCSPLDNFTPVGSHPGAAGEVASSAPASPHASTSSGVAPSHPLEVTGAAAAIHGGGSGAPISVAASSPAPGSAGAPRKRVGRPGVTTTEMVDTETGWVRATQLADGGWYLSMKDGANVGCTFLTAADVRALFHMGVDQ